jgi:hypothetical protein
MVGLPHHIDLSGFSPIEQIKFLSVGSSAFMSKGQEGRINVLDDLAHASIAGWVLSLFESNGTDLPMN